MTVTRALCIVACAATVSGCAFQGVNSLPLPGAVGRGPHANIYHIEIANIGTLESNSPVMMADVIVGSVGKMRVKGDHADIEVSVKPDAVVPANAVAVVGQTSLLGSMHVELNPPLGQRPEGRLASGATIPLDRSSSYPSTEQTLSALSVVLNSGGLGQIGDVIHNFSAALSGHENDARELLTRLDEFVGVLDQQREKIVASIEALNRLAGTFASQREVLSQALRKIPPALDVLIRERPRITTALDKLRVFSNTATGSSTTHRPIWSRICRISNRRSVRWPMWDRISALSWATCRHSRSRRTSSTEPSAVTISMSSRWST